MFFFLLKFCFLISPLYSYKEEEERKNHLFSNKHNNINIFNNNNFKLSVWEEDFPGEKPPIQTFSNETYSQHLEIMAETALITDCSFSFIQYKEDAAIYADSSTNIYKVLIENCYFYRCQYLGITEGGTIYIREGEIVIRAVCACECSSTNLYSFCCLGNNDYDGNKKALYESSIALCSSRQQIINFQNGYYVVNAINVSHNSAESYYGISIYISTNYIDLTMPQNITYSSFANNHGNSICIEIWGSDRQVPFELNNVNIIYNRQDYYAYDGIITTVLGVTIIDSCIFGNIGSPVFSSSIYSAYAYFSLIRCTLDENNILTSGTPITIKEIPMSSFINQLKLYATGSCQASYDILTYFNQATPRPTNLFQRTPDPTASLTRSPTPYINIPIPTPTNINIPIPTPTNINKPIPNPTNIKKINDIYQRNNGRGQIFRIN